MQKDQPVAPRLPRILLIEDDTLLVKMYRTKFEKEGFEVLPAYDGLSGLKIALEEDIDLIILDIMLPKLSGLDLLAKLRQYPKGKNIPVIVLTNLTQQKDAEKSISLGAKEFLIKANLTPGVVIEKVRANLGASQKGKEKTSS
jgi:DNA-binding response OmpR family regulator